MCGCMMMHTMDHMEHLSSKPPVASQEGSLLDILRRRYALGEISQEQLDEMKQVLGIEAESAARPAGGHVAHQGGDGRA